MCNSVKAIVEVSKDDLKEYLLNFYESEQIERMNLDSEITEVLNGILDTFFSDFMVYGKDSIVLRNSDYD